MSTEANKAVVRNFEEQVWNQRNPGKLGKFFSTNHVFHGPGMTIDFQGHQQMVAHFQSAFPDGVNSRHFKPSRTCSSISPIDHRVNDVQTWGKLRRGDRPPLAEVAFFHKATPSH
jgi:hypothetical protein